MPMQMNSIEKHFHVIFLIFSITWNAILKYKFLKISLHIGTIEV